MKTEEIKQRFGNLGSDETGAAFYYTAIVLFFILTILSIIYDVSAVSEKKMQAQAAADSAALEMAVWQCRGMNITQNLNNEIYDIDEVLAIMYGITAGMTLVAKAFEAMEEIPYIGEIFEAIGEAIEAAAGVIGMAAYLTHKILVQYFLIPLRGVYARGSYLMGYIGANNIAYANGADRIIPSIPSAGGGKGIFGKILNFFIKQINNMTGQFVAVGIPTSVSAALWLPLDSKDDDDIPLNIDSPSTVTGKAFRVLIEAMCLNEYLDDLCDSGGGGEGEGGEESSSAENKKSDDNGKDSGGGKDDNNANEDEESGEDESNSLFWNDNYYVSKDEHAMKIPPMIWFVHKKNSVNLISSYFLGTSHSEAKNIPILAYAVGQAMGGNVTKRSSYEHPYRPTNYGVGADAFLVPMNTINFQRSASAGGVTIKFNFQDYLDKIFLH